MPIVKSSTEINGPIDEVYRLAKNVESFPEFMPDVKSINVIERSEDGRRTVVEWVGIVKEFRTTIKWIEEDIWDDEARTCTFRLVKGDYSRYSGKWKFTDLGEHTRFDSEIDFEYDVPLIGPLIKGIIAKKMKDNVDNMLEAIKKKVEGVEG
ncbi:MAG: SRPBCC family protein [Armatimonadetes bacterium]|nr:SRPBCC family protein [Armatimonadota bacterium]